MEIKTILIPETTIEQLAEKNGLVMEVHERGGSVRNPQRFYAHFSTCDTKKGNFLVGSFGNGSTPEEAIVNYGREISEQIIVIDARGAGRREIAVPRIIPNEKEAT